MGGKYTARHESNKRIRHSALRSRYVSPSDVASAIHHLLHGVVSGKTDTFLQFSQVAKCLRPKLSQTRMCVSMQVVYGLLTNTVTMLQASGTRRIHMNNTACAQAIFADQDQPRLSPPWEGFTKMLSPA